MIEFTRHGAEQYFMRRYFRENTREPRGGECRWQELLTALDKELILRWNFIFKHYSIYYDHNGKITIVATFKPSESFGLVYQNLKEQSIMTKKMFMERHRQLEEMEQKTRQDSFNEFGEEMGKTIHKCTKGKVVNDPVIARN